MTSKKKKESWIKRLLNLLKKTVEEIEFDAGYDDKQGKYVKAKKTVKF